MTHTEITRNNIKHAQRYLLKLRYEYRVGRSSSYMYPYERKWMLETLATYHAELKGA